MMSLQVKYGIFISKYKLYYIIPIFMFFYYKGLNNRSLLLGNIWISLPAFHNLVIESIFIINYMV